MVCYFLFLTLKNLLSLLFHFKGFKRHFEALQIRELVNLRFHLIDVTNRLYILISFKSIAFNAKIKNKQKTLLQQEFKNNRTLVMLIHIRSRNLRLSSLCNFYSGIFANNPFSRHPSFVFIMLQKGKVCNYFYVTYM